MNNQEDLEDYPLTNNNYKINNETKLCEAKLNVRIGFVRKVYGILCSQLFITVLLCVAAMYSETYFSFMISKAGKFNLKYC